MLQNFFTMLLASLYSVVGNLGISIILMTVLIRSVLLPLVLPSLKARKKMNKVKPELDKLKKKYKGDKKGLQQAQMELYQKYNINPLSGCLPQILNVVVLIGLYRSLNSFLENGLVDGMTVQTDFLWLNLAQPDNTYILPILAGLVQLTLSLMISPGGEVRDIVPNQSKNKVVKQKNEEEEDVAEMAQSMQQQMIFIMPVMTAFIAARLPSGLAVYWVATSFYSIIQQYFVSGPGGLKKYYQRIKLKLSV